MDIRCAAKADFDRVVSFYKYVIENTQEMKKAIRLDALASNTPAHRLFFEYMAEVSRI